MRKLSYILYTLILFALVSCGKKTTITEYNIIPQPVEQNYSDGTFTFSKKSHIYFENIGQNSETAKYITKHLRKMHFRPSLSGKDLNDCIVFTLNQEPNNMIGNEGYTLDIRTNGIYITANTETGLFYGYQSFVQMLPDDMQEKRYNAITLTCCSIIDYPAFTWRGCLRDVSRHFFGVNDIKKQLDLMASYKMNKFHWHLTDDHGWRIEIEKYPMLNEKASWRVDRDSVAWGTEEPAREDEPRTYGGFYTKEEISEIVDYAARLHIDVIPEIDIPGHCAAILEAYPQFGCADDDTTYQIQIGPYWPPRAILCGGNDSVMQFLKDVMDEIIPLFPYEYIHIGGDEAWKDNWRKCSRCQARIRSLGMKGEEELQGWMILQIEQYLAKQGKKIIGWDEILDGGVSQEATVMSWQGFRGAVNAAQHGNYAIMTPTEYCYYNFYQANPAHVPAAMSGFVTLYKAYQFNPIPKGLTPKQQKFILGGQCNIWAEFINTEEQAEYMMLPRLLAMSECLWTPAEKKDWPNFRKKVEVHKKRLSAMGYAYGESSFIPEIFTTNLDANTLELSFDWDVEGTQIYYTTDGSEPTNTTGTLYTDPIKVSVGTTINVASYLNGELKEEVYTLVCYDKNHVGYFKPMLFTPPTNPTDHLVKFFRNAPTSQMYYTLDGTEPCPENGNLYIEPFETQRGTKVRVASYIDGKLMDKVYDFIIK